MSTEGHSLEHLIDGHADADPIEAVTQPTPEPAPEPTGETIAAPPAADQQQPPDDGPTVPRRALEDERRKRQDLADKLEEMQKWVQQQFQSQRQPQPQQEQPQAPDMWTDPEGAVRHMLTKERENYERQLFMTRVEHGQEVLRMRHADYDEVEQIFVAAAQHAPHLQAELMRSPNPARFAYETGRRIKLMQDIGDDPEAYIERKLAERQANGGSPAQPQPNPQAPTRSTAPVPKSLASTASATPRNERGQFTERVPIDQLLG